MAMFGKKKEASVPEKAGSQGQADGPQLGKPKAAAFPAGPSRLTQNNTNSRPQPPSAMNKESSTEAAEAEAPKDSAASAPSPISKDGGVTVSRPAVAKPVTPPIGERSPFAHSAAQSNGGQGDAGGKRLSVGPGISLSGEIKNCEQLLVEGEIEATLKDCANLDIAPGGLFKGTAEVENATVSGRFDGDLKVTGVLTVKKGGEVAGTIAYNELSTERGGRLRGKLEDLKS